MWSALPSEQQFTIIMAGGAAVFGGLISLATSLILQSNANRRAKSDRTRHKLEEDAARATLVLYQILAIGDALHSLKCHIDECFKNADENGLSDLEPFMKVSQISGSRFEVNSIDASDLIFLAHVREPQMVSSVLMVERRAATILNSARDFSERRKEFDQFTMDNLPEDADINTGVSGAAAGFNLSGRAAHQAVVQSSVLQNLLGQIMEMLDRDIPFVKSVAGDLNEKCRSHFSASFPTIQMKWVE